MIKILLLEDDLTLGESIEEMLCESGYETDWVKSGDEAADASYDKKYDLYIFDVNVPGMSGFELVDSLRGADDTTPAIFISAMVDMASISKGFEVGADDYIKKPFYPEELLLRIEARFGKRKKSLSLGGISFEPSSNEVYKDGKLVVLGEVQQPMLKLLLENIGKTVEKERFFELMEHPSDSALRFAINKLRHTTGWDIKNIRGVGYRVEKS